MSIDLEERFDTIEEMEAFMKRVAPMNIYDDVEELQQQVAELQNTTATIDKRTKWTELEANTDLNTLAVGNYIIPTGAIAGTLINKPNNTSTMTGFISVVPGGNAGQLTMYYFVCSKYNIKHWERAYYAGEWGDWTEIINGDSGWRDLPLAEGIIPYSDYQRPRYRRIGKVVYISGVLRGVTGKDQTVATLPDGYRPSMKVMFAVPSVGQIITKMSVDTNGAVTLNRSTIEPITAENWHSIACSFVAD